MTTSVQKESAPLNQIRSGQDWNPEGDGWYGTAMSEDIGITITKRVTPDGSTEFDFTYPEENS
jgi:hypothetical protein